MTVSAKMYSHFPTHLLNALLVGMGSETAIKCALTTSSYTVNQETHDYFDDITNEVANGAGYTTGGVALTNTAITEATRVTTYDATDAEWANATITARYAVLYDSTEANANAQPLIMYVDFGENKSSEAGTFKIAWNASGIFSVTVAA